MPVDISARALPVNGKDNMYHDESWWTVQIATGTKLKQVVNIRLNHIPANPKAAVAGEDCTAKCVALDQLDGEVNKDAWEQVGWMLVIKAPEGTVGHAVHNG